MAFTYGFYNSFNGDRRYNAFEMSKLFDGIIEDGVFETIGQHFAVTAGSGMSVNVGTGRAWFNHTWNENDSVMPINLPDSDLNRSRYDAIVIEIGDPNSDRENAIKVVSGTPAVNPSKPVLNRGPSNNSGVSPDVEDTLPPYQHALAYILVQPGIEEITAADIQFVVGMEETPFVTGPIETRSIETLFNQWDAQFAAWFANLKAQLTENVVTNLQNQIDELKTADHIFITNAIANDIGVPIGSSVDYVLKYLDDQNEALINAIKNSANFVKTADYTTAGTFTHRVNGTKAFAIIVGGGGGGAGGPSATGRVWGGGGGGGGHVEFSSIISTTKGGTYNIVVGSGGAGVGGGAYANSYGTVSTGRTGGTSSAFGTTAAGGTGGSSTSYGGSGGASGGGGSNGSGDGGASGGSGSGGSGSSQSYTGSSGHSMGVSGGGGGGGGASAVHTSANKYGSSGGSGGSYGGGSGGSGGNVINSIATHPENGTDATGYGCGGGGGGGRGSYSWEDDQSRTDPGTGGNGKCGRVIIYEAGAFVI